MSTYTKTRLYWGIVVGAFIVVCLIATLPTIVSILNPFSGRLATHAYKDPVFAYTFTPPAGWRSMKEMNGQIPGIVFSGDHGTSSIKIFSSAVLPSSRAHAASEVTAFLEKQTVTLEQYALVSDAPVAFKNYDAYQYEMTFTKTGEKYRTRSLVVTGAHAVFIIVASAPDSIWPQFEKAAFKSIGTFTLVK
jgi:hypothetical protein